VDESQAARLRDVLEAWARRLLRVDQRANDSERAEHEREVEHT
jgi:hypothetical protein